MATLKQTKPRPTKTAKQKLDEGAKKIRDLKSKVEKEKIKIVESKRPAEAIWRERVTVLPGSVGLKIDKATPIGECLRILDYTLTLNAHVGWMIGDVTNFGKHAYGEKYQQALNQTGRAYSTLAAYAETAARIAPSDRIAALTFSHHRELIRAGDKMPELLKDADAEVKKGKIPTVRELREVVNKVKPRKRKAVKVVEKAEVEPYVPTEDEVSFNTATWNTLSSIDVTKLEFIKKIEADARKAWASLLAPFANLCDALLKSLV